MNKSNKLQVNNEKKYPSDLIEVHNRPIYVKYLLNEKMQFLMSLSFYFQISHHHPLIKLQKHFQLDYYFSEHHHHEEPTHQEEIDEANHEHDDGTEHSHGEEHSH